MLVRVMGLEKIGHSFSLLYIISQTLILRHFTVIGIHENPIKSSNFTVPQIESCQKVVKIFIAVFREIMSSTSATNRNSIYSLLSKKIIILFNPASAFSSSIAGLSLVLWLYTTS